MNMIQTPLLLPSNHTNDERLIVPFTVLDNRSSLEEFITSITVIRENAHRFLSQSVQRIDLQQFIIAPSSSHSSSKFIYVLQGELAHVSSDGLLLSDQATTCHILAIHSTSHYNNNDDDDTTTGTMKIMGSLCHLDAPQVYTSCIEKMIYTHLDYHQSTSTNKNNEGNNNNSLLHRQIIRITFHLLGGYLDTQGLSKAISNDILGTLIDVTLRIENDNTRFQKTSLSQYTSIQWKLATCAITSLNTTNIINASLSCQIKKNLLGPIGRGLALDVASGNVFIPKMNPECFEHDSIVPMYILRHVRLWFNKSPHQLNLIHHHTTADDNLLFIPPFHFFPSSKTAYLLSLVESDPMKLLEYTSTSPECEEDEYCNQVIQMLRFIHQVSCSSVFGNVGREKGLKYQFMNGGWRRIICIN